MLDDDEESHLQIMVEKRDIERGIALEHNKAVLSEVSTQISQNEIFRC